MRIKHIYILFLCLTMMLSAQKSSIEWENYTEDELCFINSRDTLFGKLVLPKKARSTYPVVVFVHGSGPEDYSSSDLYRPLWERFTKAGFACFSWDRPGVGRSQGNWFEKSISDRVSEVENAVNRLKQHPKVDLANIGFWGLSQAGWILPKVAETIHPVFVISVSGAVTTAFDQEVHRLRTELGSNGYSTAAIDSATAYISTVKRLALEDKPFAEFDKVQQEIKGYRWSSHAIMGGEPIYQYLKVIIKGDSAPDLTSLTCPVLAIWGENDLLVPPRPSAEHYTKVMEEIGNMKAKVAIIPNADHTLTYNISGKRKETLERREAYRDEPEKIFAPGYLDLMVGWLESLKLASKKE